MENLASKTVVALNFVSMNGSATKLKLFTAMNQQFSGLGLNSWIDLAEKLVACGALFFVAANPEKEESVGKYIVGQNWGAVIDAAKKVVRAEVEFRKSLGM